MAEERTQQRRLVAILAADVVGYSRLMEANEAGTLAALKSRRKDILDPLVTKHQGRVFKTTGDGVLVEFASAVNAVQCAVELQRGMAAANDGEHEDRHITLRIGLNLGDVMVEGGDLYGDGVNIAARLETIAAPGGICISAKLRDEIGRKLDLALDDLGEQVLKNITSPVRAYRIWPDTASLPVRPNLALPNKPSIAILPFQNMSDDPEQEYFAAGIADDIITDLSKISGLFVIARNSSFTYRGKVCKSADVCRDLGVRYLLEGSVRRSGNRVRVTAQLIDGQDGGHMWSERFDRELTDIFVVQDEITRHIVAALAVRLLPDEGQRLALDRTVGIEAYDFFLRGVHQVYLATKDSNAEARILLERAITLNPDWARPYANLSHNYLFAYVNGWDVSAEPALQRAYELALQSISLDGDDPEVHWNLGLIHLWRREHDLAIAAERTVVARYPSFATGHAALGSALNYAGRSKEGIEPILTAMRLDPYYSDHWLHSLAISYFGIGRYEEAETTLRRRIIRRPDTDISRVLLAACLGHLGRFEEAISNWREALRYNPSYSLVQKRETLPYKNPQDFERIVEGLRKAGLPE
jgi:adenylate cyclase